MAKQRLFVLAMYAMKLDPSRVRFTPQEDGTVHWELKEMLDERAGLFPSVSLWAVAALAESEDEAREMGMQRLLEECPWQEGWVNHHVTLNTVPRKILLKAAAVPDEDEERDADDDDGEDEPEAIM
ncbi:MAG: hypothetical protein ICV60_04595 [Pyrinomonadaceae bacterium]|nr:hypothetical protein [Pyrinomonadaceae bacterium]